MLLQKASPHPNHPRHPAAVTAQSGALCQIRTNPIGSENKLGLQLHQPKTKHNMADQVHGSGCPYW